MALFHKNLFKNNENNKMVYLGSIKISNRLLRPKYSLIEIHVFGVFLSRWFNCPSEPHVELNL